MPRLRSQWSDRTSLQVDFLHLFNFSFTDVSITEAEVVVSREEVPAIEPVGNDNTTAIAPVIVNEEQLVQIAAHENLDDIPIEEAPNTPVRVQITIDDILLDDIPLVDIPLVLNEDYEVSHPVSEPHVGPPSPPLPPPPPH